MNNGNQVGTKHIYRGTLLAELIYFLSDSISYGSGISGDYCPQDDDAHQMGPGSTGGGIEIGW
jgi:hypothetical protein